MISDASLSRLTTGMIVYDSLGQLFSLKIPREPQLQLQKFVFMFMMIIMTKKILKTKITL